MKERKCDSLFSFRRGTNRYSLHLEKPSKKEADVQLKRASWSSFPLLKFSSFDDRSSKEQLATTKSQSSEDVKHNSYHQAINTPKIGCNFLRGSTASIRSAFSSSSSASSSSSSSSSPSIRSSGSSGKSSITSILEGSISDSHYDSNSTVEDNPPYLPASHYHQTETHLLRSSSDFITPFSRNPLLTEERGTSSVPSLIKEEQMSPTSPKIVYAHKKTPDVKRKSRKQLVQEYEWMKENGSLPEKLELLKSNPDEEKENVIPRSRSSRSVGKSKSNFKFMQNYKFLSKIDSKHSPKTLSNETEIEVAPENNSVSSSSLDDENDDHTLDRLKPPESYSSSPDKANVNQEATVTSAVYNPLSQHHHLSPQSDALPYSLTTFLNSKISDFVESSPTTFGVISDVIEEEDSECDLSEFMVYAEESSCFERSLEAKLEMMADKEVDPEKDYDSERRDSSEFKYKQNETAQSPTKRTELKLNLVKPQHPAFNKVYKSRLLRHISEEPDSGASGSEEDAELRSPCRTPGTPRSPAIDIDDVFKQKQREIEDGQKDDMSRVKDLAMRLKLATRRPSYLDWLGTLKRTKDMSNPLVMDHPPPLVLEDGQQEQELTEEVRKKNLQSALSWLREELLEMRQQDQQLARQLMQLRIELQRVRLLRSCNNHQALVDEVTNEAEEARTFECNDLCEVPQDLRETFSPVLREIGVTRMNITSRRFSLR